MNKRTMKKMAKAKQQAAEAAKTAETVVKTAAPAKEVKPTTEQTLHTEAAEGKAEAAKEPKKATKKDRQIFLSWKELTGEQPKPYVLKHEPIIKQELVSEAFQLAYDAIVIELKNARATKWRDTSYKGALEMMKTLVTITEQMGR